MSVKIQIENDFLEEPLWQELSPDYQHIFLVLLSRFFVKDRLFDDHGKMIFLNRRQISITFRELHRLCHKSIPLIKISRAIKIFERYTWIKHEVVNTRSTLTLTDERCLCVDL
jgi:hypothetical protein